MNDNLSESFDRAKREQESEMMAYVDKVYLLKDKVSEGLKKETLNEIKAREFESWFYKMWPKDETGL